MPGNFGPRTFKYWNNHNDIPIPTNWNIDWKASQAAAKKLPQGLRRWKAKFASDWIGVSSKLKQYKWQDHSTCPLCNAPSETVSHVLHYKDPQAVQFAKTRIQETLKLKLTELLLLSPSSALQPSIPATFQSGLHGTHITSRRLFGRNRK